MNGIADLGGADGFGPVPYKASEPRFHHEWERLVFGLDLAVEALGLVPTDAVRFGVERVAPDAYLRMGYYERWLAALEWVLAEWGVVEGAEVADGSSQATQRSRPANGDQLVDQILETVRRGAPKSRLLDIPPRFDVGSTVRARRLSPKGHTRLPRYVRGCVGEVQRLHGVFVLPDSVAHGLGEAPQHLYGVSFDLADLWTDRADGSGVLNLDLYDSYLEPA